MSEPTGTTETHRVEVWFRIEKDEDGYPKSKEWEGLICTCLDSIQVYRIESVPFYVKGVAVGDVISAKEAEEGYYRFDHLVSRGGHATYRLFVETAPEEAECELENLGCAVETAAGGNLIAVDVPPELKIQVRDHLHKGFQEGRWDLQEASADE
jgi:hypothetical protein